MTRPERVAQFRRSAGGGWFNTSLREAGEYRGREAAAVANWFLQERVVRPQCFSCRNVFTAEKRPAAFLCATASRSPSSGIAVAACCRFCWSTLVPGAIEAAALACLRRQLNPNGKWLDDGVRS
jgi:hypothetical protein